MSDFDNWTELELLTGLIDGEAEGEPWHGKVAVATVAKVRWMHPGHWNWGRNPREVILKPMQFSCFNRNDPNRERILSNAMIRTPQWRECEMIAQAVYCGHIKDFLDDMPTHYHVIDPGGVIPKWAKNMNKVFRVGKHQFYSCFKKS